MSDGDDRGEKVTTVSREAMTHALFRDGPAREVDLPDDVEIEELWHRPTGEGYGFRLSSAEWDATREGVELEHVRPTVTAERDDTPTLRDAFVAGFMATGEGMNGEYAGSMRADPKEKAEERFKDWRDA